MLLNNDLKLNLFSLETGYRFDMVVCTCLEKSILSLMNFNELTLMNYQLESRNFGCLFEGLILLKRYPYIESIRN